MFDNDVVNIPKKVKFNTKKSGVYVYHIFNSSSKEKKYSTDKRVLIGKKMDDKTMHPNNKYYEIYNVEKKELSKLEQREFSDTLSVGDTSLIQSIADNISLSRCLNKVYDEDDTNMIIN